MPELPEVEKMAQKLQGWCAGRTITSYRVLRNPGGRYEPMGTKAKVENVFRRGKQLVFSFDNGISMLCHNAMSGYWDTTEEPWTFDYVEGRREATDRDVRVEFSLDDGKTLRFHDARLFGRISTGPTAVVMKHFEKIGPEAIRTPRMLPESPTFNIMDSAVFLSGKKPIKQLLLEQERIAGVGNIYAAEALWRARIHPTRQGVSLKGEDHQRLLEAVQSVLKDALAYDLKYQDYLKVYRQSHCKNCGNPIEKIDVAKRTTYFCVRCQK